MWARAMTVWSGAGGVLFGRMYEDPAIELRAFHTPRKVFAIASAGCTARALAAAGHIVTAVDINPRQLAYARARAGGAAAIDGVAERFLAGLRRMLALAGWTRGRLTEFLDLDDVREQSACWRNVLDPALPGGLARRLRDRLHRCCATHPNRANPYLRSLLCGERPAEPAASVRPIEFVRADAAAYLEACRPGIFDGFALSNIGDGASPAYVRRLWAAVRRASAPGAVVVHRSFGEPRSESDGRFAAMDRTGIWGRVNVEA